MNRGERMANRTRSAIKQAFLELIHQANYPEITVNRIIEKANVGRSTFYKHYRSRADVLVDIHRDMFTHLFSTHTTPQQWLGEEPPALWGEFLEENRRLGRHPFSLSYKLGKDLDFLVHNVNEQLTRVIAERLSDAFPESDHGIPPAVLAHSVSALFSGLVMSWFTRFQGHSPHRFAGYMHCLIRGQIQEAVNVNIVRK